MSQEKTSSLKASHSSADMYEPVVGQAVNIGEEQKDRSNHWEVRTQEQGYAFLADPNVKDENRYGQKIDLIDLTGLPENKSMFINENMAFSLRPIIVLVAMPVRRPVAKKMKTHRILHFAL